MVKGVGYILSIKQVILQMFLLLVIKLIFFLPCNVKLKYNWKMIFRILSCQSFLCVLNTLQKSKL